MNSQIVDDEMSPDSFGRDRRSGIDGDVDRAEP